MPYEVNPKQGDLATAKATVEGVFEACHQRLPTERTVSVGLCWSDDPVVAAEFGGARGFCLGPERVEIEFTSGVEGWADAVGGVATRQYGRSWVRGKLPDETRLFWWQELVEAAAGERLAMEYADEWSPPWESVDREALRSWWPEVKSNLGHSVEDEFVETAGTEEEVSLYLPEAYAVVFGTVGRTEFDIEEYPTLRRSDVTGVLDDVFEE